MKGYKNIKQITQRVMCNDETAQKILQFEDNKYLKMNKLNFWIYEISFDQCISLQDLIESIQDNYVRIFKGQAILIMEKIVEHLYELHKLNIIHENLNPNNIFIKLIQDSNRFNIYQEIIQIELIYFTNYKWLDNEVQEYQLSSDLKSLKENFIKLIQAIDNKEQEIINLIKIFDVKSDRKFTFKMLNTLREFIEKNIDQTTQQLKKNEITNFNSKIRLRYNYEGTIQQQIERIFNLESKQPQILEDNELDVSIIQTIQSKTDQLQKFLLQNFHFKLLKKFQKFAGNQLENNYKITEQDFKAYFQDNEIDQQLGFKIEQLKQSLNGILQLPEQIKNKINEKFKFHFDKFDQIKLIETYEDFLYSNSIKYDLKVESEFNKFLDDINKQMKECLKEYYELELQLKLTELDFSLI